MSGTASNATGQFQIANGQIISPSGNTFTAEGINLYDSQMGDASQILTDFPGINFIRLNVYSYQSPSAYASFIQTMTSAGVVVELEDHTNSTGSDSGAGAGNAFSGSQLTNELNWYGSVASAYASNPDVWFGTDNEPPTPGLSSWEQQTYNAIRDAGNNNPVMMELPGGGYPGQNAASYGMDPSVYASMSNIVWDVHNYGWDSNYSTNQQDVNSALTGLVQQAQAMTSANGTVPVIVGEYGPSTNGESTDPNANQVLQGVQQAAQSGETAGAVAWGWDAGANDNLTDGQGNLTSYGQEVAQWFASNPGTSASSSSGAAPTSAPPPSSGQPASANDTVVMAGSSSTITDTSGNQWTINGSGQVAVNGVADTTTANVTELAYVNNAVWQENASNLWWSKTSPTAAWSPGDGTTTSPLPASSPNDSVVMAGSSSTITDASGNQWTINGSGQVAVNGVADTTTANVTELAYVNNAVWQENASNLWWGKTSPTAAWSPGDGTTTSPLPAPSAASQASSPIDSMVLAGSSSTLTDASGNQWTINGSGQVAVNGVADTTTANVTELAYVNNAVWQENSSNLWWSKTSPTAAWSPGDGTTTSPLPAPITLAAGSTSETVTQSQVSVAATSGNQMLFMSGSGNIVTLTGGADTISDTGSGNTYILPAAGQGTDTFSTNILSAGDTLDLMPALAATNWNGASSTLSNYLSVADQGNNAVLSVAPTSGGAATAIATITGASGTNLTTLLAHSIT